MLYRLYFLLPELYGYSTNSPNHQNMPVKQHLWFKSTLVQVEVECSSHAAHRASLESGMTMSVLIIDLFTCWPRWLLNVSSSASRDTQSSDRCGLGSSNHKCQYYTHIF